jgi:site-specific DNA-methyltransferase (adenine-specific)
MSELQHWIKHNTKFIFKSLITWDKLTNADTIQIGNLAKGYGNLRNYFSGSTAEYICFYTKQDNDLVLLNQRDYLLQQWKKSGLSIKDIKKLCGFSGNQPYNWFSPNNNGKATWQLPKEEYYKILQTTGYWQKPYEKLRNEFIHKRYKFNKPEIKIKGTNLDELKNNLRNITTVWNFERPKDNYKLGHVTPKPVEMIEHIIKVSSNENDIVLDCFMGSGTTAIACINTNRKYIGFELNEDYFKVAEKRIRDIVVNAS